mmetsp:Transcript_8561/g.27294  ORF Transcript_8561/g.27294 Transcript_8561/m.27294 type:complete len:243 (-) Transcript_8561:333-1061(-)
MSRDEESAVPLPLDLLSPLLPDAVGWSSSASATCVCTAARMRGCSSGSATTVNVYEMLNSAFSASAVLVERTVPRSMRTIRSHSASSSSKKWEATSVTRSSREFCSNFHSWRRASTSTPAECSSRMSNDGRDASAMARHSFRFCPPDRALAVCCCDAGASPTDSRTAGPSTTMPLIPATSAMCSRHVSSSCRWSLVCGTKPVRARMLSMSSSMDKLYNEAVPDVGWCSPTRHETSVDLPLPL